MTGQAIVFFIVFCCVALSFIFSVIAEFTAAINYSTEVLVRFVIAETISSFALLLLLAIAMKPRTHSGMPRNSSSFEPSGTRNSGLEEELIPPQYDV